MAEKNGFLLSTHLATSNSAVDTVGRAMHSKKGHMISSLQIRKKIYS